MVAICFDIYRMIILYFFGTYLYIYIFIHKYLLKEPTVYIIIIINHNNMLSLISALN